MIKGAGESNEFPTTIIQNCSGLKDLMRETSESVKDHLPWIRFFSLSGFQVVEPGEKLSCSLIASKGLSDLRSPWQTFSISVPPGLLKLWFENDNFAEVTFIVYGENTGMSVAFRSRGHLWFIQIPKSLKNLEAAVDAWTWGEDGSEHVKRILQCCRGLLLGCIAELDGGMVIHPKVGLGKTKADGKPRLSVHRLVRPVVHDVRREVAAYCRGEGKSPTVRTMVRGHWKRQVYGPGRTERKWIHVEPFWRGPKDGPITIRPHRFAEKSC